MIVICEECGKKYRIDPEKIRGAEAKFKCRSCSHEIVIHKPQDKPEAAPDLQLAAPAVEQPAAAPAQAAAAAPAEDRTTRKLKFGVRGKMILLFFLLPGMISALAALYSVAQISRTADAIVEASADHLRHVAEIVLANESRLLAARVGEHLSGKSAIRSADLSGDPELSRILSQGVSWGGTAFIYALPAAAKDGWRTWAHPNPKLVGVSLDSMQKEMGDGYSSFQKVYSGVKGAPVSKGYFKPASADGAGSETYMVARLIEGTGYVLAITAPAEQMIGAVRQIKDATEYQVYTSSLVTVGMLLLAFLLIGITVTLYGHRLTSRIKYLTDVSDRISVGDLDTEIKLKSDDEIGDLAESISRMQDSLRLSIERLRRKR
jgi:predicted Zn finger-like uncharacterized protein